MLIDDEIMAHKRKKESTTSKASKKSKHKHEYKECLLRNITCQGEYLHKGRVCTICRKTVIDEYLISKKTQGSIRILLNNDEILKEYSNLEIVTILNN